MQVGYCGNVHPGQTLEEVKHNLTKYTLKVKAQVYPNRLMPIGLWLSATAAKELDEPECLLGFKDWLAEHGLLPYTLNGFPYGDFHQEIVKHDVYRPTWGDPSRMEYTIRLAEILDTLLPEGVDGTISTLPLAWPVEGNHSYAEDQQFWSSCAKHLKNCAERLDRIQQTSGRNIFVCIEPEPGCMLDTWDDVVGFFDQHLLADSKSADLIRKHIGVCHDVCHSAVMFEKQSTAVNEYKKAGIKIGKVQVSSAVAVDFESGDELNCNHKIEQLRGFAEPKYLHQTSIRTGDDIEFYEDLSIALDANPNPTGLWHVHFHVPIFSNEFDLIGTTQADIKHCVEAILQSNEPMPHFEIETYAWNVLPDHLKQDSLAEGIAKEITWFNELISAPI
ncbi:MAG: metabolite traffic protein EboE [Mariniblastus sp.]|nr:metabolite traffic protein EboE [Mariniblastus sp.]